MNIDKIDNSLYARYRHKSNEVKKVRNVRELWNQHELHILGGGSKRQFTIPRGRVMHRLLDLDGF